MQAMEKLKQGINGLFAATALSGSLLMATPALAQDNDNNSTTLPEFSQIDPEFSAQQSAAPAGDGSELFDQSWLQSVGSPVDINNPWILLAWPAALAALWLALRSVPMRPDDMEFGPMEILQQIIGDESDADKMPLPEKLIWATAVSAAFLAASGVEPNEGVSFPQEGRILIAVDADWAAAPNWGAQRDAILEILRNAHNDEREIVFLKNAAGENGEPIHATAPMHSAAALSYLENMQTVPWPADRESATLALESLQAEGGFGATFWMSNGLADAHTPSFVEALESLAPLQVFDDLNKPALLLPVEYNNGEYLITVRRADIAASETMEIQAFDAVNRVIATQDIVFAEQQSEAQITFPAASFTGAQGDVARFSISHENSAGATVLTNENHKPRSVGIAAINGRNDAASLLNEARFLYAALQPHTDIYFGTVEELIDSGNISVLLVPDSVPLTGVAATKAEEWARSGGRIARFAGPNMALEAHIDDPLLPVDIRKGSIGSNDSLSSNQDHIGIESFDANSPFAALEPEDEVIISRYVAVDSTRPNEYETWARMSNGFPLVTANALGEGSVVLFHTTGNSNWSDLAFSENFVEMLLSSVKSATSIENAQDYAMPDLPPLSVLNSAGELTSPSGIIADLDQNIFESGLIGPYNPPGLYGNSVMQVPFNLSHTIQTVELLGEMHEEISRKYYAADAEQNNVQGWLWATAMALGLAGAAALGVRNGFGSGLGNSIRRNDNDPAPGI